MQSAFPYLLLPTFWAARNRVRRREHGDGLRALAFGGLGAFVVAVLFVAVFWLTWLVLDYEELGGFLIRMGLSWLFLTFLSFVAFSALVTSLSAFFLSEDLRLLLAAPVPRHRLFYSRLARAAGQASWMVVAFLTPALLGIGFAHCASWHYYVAVPLAIVPFVLIPSALGAATSLVLVNVFPARRVRDFLVLVSLVFVVAVIVVVRMVRPEQLLRIESLPDIPAFFAALQSPVTPLLPSTWAGEVVYAALTRRWDTLHLGALWTTALALTVLARLAYDRLYFDGWSKAQEARKARFSKLALLEWILDRVPMPPATRSLVGKDVKLFFRDPAQWSQLLLILALVVVYLYSFSALDLSKLPYMTDIVKNMYAFMNMALAGLVLASVAVRFVFPAISLEGAAFWIIRKSPTSLRAVVASKFWTSLLPVLLLVETLTILSNELLGVHTFLKLVAAGGLFVQCFALVGLALGLGARYPRFSAENATQVSGSYGGVLFMVQAVLFVIVEVALMGWPSSLYLWHVYRGLPFSTREVALVVLCLVALVAFGLLVTVHGLRTANRALERLGD